MKELNAILIGCGTMGQRHRARFESCGVRFLKALDVDAPRWIRGAECAEMLAGKAAGCPRPDFAVVASPASTHYEYAKFFLENGVPVMVEKPLATTAEQARELVKLAESRNVTLFVAQSECYNPIFLTFRRHFLVDLKRAVMASRAAGDADRGSLKANMEFRREHGFTERCRDVDVSLDLLVHDLSLFLNMFRYEDLKVTNVEGSGDRIAMELKVVSGEFSGVNAYFVANRNSDCDARTITATFGKNGNVTGFDYTVSLARYMPGGGVAHVPDSLDNEHRFFLKLLAGDCREWGRRAARAAADVVALATWDSTSK